MEKNGKERGDWLREEGKTPTKTLTLQVEGTEKGDDMVVMTRRRNGVTKTMRIEQRRNQNQRGGGMENVIQTKRVMTYTKGFFNIYIIF